MAARRLIIVMIILLGVSTAIAIVVPEPRQPDSQEESASTGTSGTTGATGNTGTTGTTGAGNEPVDSAGPGPKTIEANIEAGEEPPEFEARPGDRVILTVATEQPTDVAIRSLGLFATTGPGTPAVFDLILPSGEENYNVVDEATGKAIGVIDTTGSEPIS